MCSNIVKSDSDERGKNPIIPAQIRIGVTGHRDLPNEDGVRKAIKEVIDRINKRLKDNMPNGTPYQYVAVSPLAEGADRIVANVILKCIREDEADKPILEVPLPVPVKEYEKSFKGGEPSVKAFETFLLEAEKIELLPPTEKQFKYLQVGQHVVRNCDVLIAIWDGKEAAGAGGTAIIVEYAREKKHAIFWIHSVTLEIKEENIDDDTFEPFRHLDTYNGEKAEDLPETISERLRKTLSKASTAPSIHGLLEDICKILLPHWAKASAISTDYKISHNRLGLVIYGLSALAVATVTIQGLFFHDFPQIIWFEVVLMVFILGAIQYARVGRLHRKWTDSRFFVERLRALENMRVGELECTPPEAPGLGGDWVIRAYNYVWRELRKNVPCSRHPGPSSPTGALWGMKHPVDNELRNYLIDAWIKNQRDFYQDSSEKNRKEDRKLGFWVYLFFCLTLLAAILHALELGAYFPNFPGYLDAILTSIAIIGPAFGAAINGIRAYREFHRNAERYHAMAKYLTSLIEQIRLVGDESDFNDLVETAYDAMLQENLDWRLTFFSRRHEVP